VRCQAQTNWVLQVENCRSGEVSGLTFEHIGTDDHTNRFGGVDLTHSSIEIRQCKVQQSAGHGIRISGQGSPTIQDCVVQSNSWDGICVEGSGAAPTLTNNYCRANQHHGIYFSAGAGGTAIANTAIENTGSGIVIADKTTAPLLQNNICRANAKHGLCFSDGAAGTVEGNTCEENAGCGILVSGAGTNPRLEANRCIGNQKTGICYEEEARPAVTAGNGPDLMKASQQLCQAASEGDTNTATQILRNHPEIINAQDAALWTPLHYAAVRGHKGMAALLLSSGADINAKSDDGWTPLHLAAGNGHKQVSEFLLSKGANAQARDNSGKTPADRAERERHYDLASLLRQGVRRSDDDKAEFVADSTVSAQVVVKLPRSPSASDISLLASQNVLYVVSERPLSEPTLDALKLAGIKTVVGFSKQDTISGYYLYYMNACANHPAIIMWALDVPPVQFEQYAGKAHQLPILHKQLRTLPVVPASDVVEQLSQHAGVPLILRPSGVAEGKPVRLDPAKIGPEIVEPTATDAGKIAVIDTKFGNIAIELYGRDAPRTVANFIKLASEGFYDGVTFHRVIPGFMIQGGDPLSKDADRIRHGTGGPGYTLPAEIKRENKRGTVATARLADQVNPQRESNGSQFFINVKDNDFLNGSYTVFGHVIAGMDVVDRIANVPRDSRDNPLEKVEMNKMSITTQTEALKK
jgi:parallel beta-helix repeat protein